MVILLPVHTLALTRATCTVVLLLLGGCIAVPIPVIPEKDAFSTSALADLSPGTSRRADVETLFGKPPVVRQGGAIAVYGHARTIAAVFGATLFYTAGLMPVERDSTLVVEYDSSDVVRVLTVLRGARACAPSGLCVDARFDWQPSSGLPEYDGVLVDAVVSSTAERHRGPTDPGDACLVVVFASEASSALMVLAGERWIPGLTSNRFVLVEFAPGAAELLVRDRDLHEAPAHFDCARGSVRYFDVAATPHAIAPLAPRDGWSLMANRARILD